MPTVRAALQRGQSVRITVSGDSMVPFIYDGDVVELEAMSSPPALGDILFTWRKDPVESCLLHRVVRLDGDTFFLRGDAQRHRDGPYARSDILAKVTHIYGKGRVRSLGTVRWRVAGRVWLAITPVGLWLLPFAARVRGWLARLW